jgi:hypothetical protein
MILWEWVALVLSLRKWFERAKFISLFLVCTFVLYHLLQAVSAWFTPHIRFGQPSGHAVKAYIPQATSVVGSDFTDRLRFFYWYGE